MVIYGVSFDMVGKQPIVLLKTVAGNKFLPIWIGHAEAAAILMKLQGAETPRPMTHDLLTDVLGSSSAEITQDHRHRAAGEHLLRAITLRAPAARSRSTRARATPSRSRCAATRPIFAADKVIEESGDRVRARGRGHRRGRREVQGVPRPGQPGGLPDRGVLDPPRNAPGGPTAARRSATDLPGSEGLGVSRLVSSSRWP